MQKRWIITAIALAAIIISGYFIFHSHSSSDPLTVTPAPTASLTPLPSPASPSQTPGIPTPTPVAIVPCAPSSLTLSLKPDNAAAGHAYDDLVFVNGGTVTCTLYGIPALVLVDNTGQQLGTAAAQSSGEGAVTVNLDQGQAAHTLIDFPNAANFQAGTCSAAATNLKVTLPGTTAPLLVASNQKSCPGWSVQPVRMGATEE